MEQPCGVWAWLNLTQHSHIDHIWTAFPLYGIVLYVAVNLDSWLLYNHKIRIWTVSLSADSFYDPVEVNQILLQSRIRHI